MPGSVGWLPGCCPDFCVASLGTGFLGLLVLPPSGFFSIQTGGRNLRFWCGGLAFRLIKENDNALRPKDSQSRATENPNPAGISSSPTPPIFDVDRQCFSSRSRPVLLASAAAATPPLTLLLCPCVGFRRRALFNLVCTSNFKLRDTSIHHTAKREHLGIHRTSIVPPAASPTTSNIVRSRRAGRSSGTAPVKRVPGLLVLALAV